MLLCVFSGSVLGADNFDPIISKIQNVDSPSAESREEVIHWLDSPHEPAEFLPVISALNNSLNLRSVVDYTLSVQCTAADVAQCQPAFSAVESFAPSEGYRGSSGTTTYVLLLVPAEIRRSKADDNETSVSSTFIAGHTQVPNPRYFALQNQYQSVQIEA
jgi:hypothetical protein